MHDDAGPDFLQSIANIGSGARKRGECRQSSDFRSMQDCKTTDNSEPRPHNISGRLKRKAVAADADKTRPDRDFRLALAEYTQGGRDRNLRLAFGLVAARLLRRKCRVYRKPTRACRARSRKINGLQPLDFAHANHLIFVQARPSSRMRHSPRPWESPCAAPLCTSASVR